MLANKQQESFDDRGSPVSTPGRFSRPHTWSTKVRFELADPTHQVITGKTIDKVTNYGGSTLIPPRTLPQGEQMAIPRYYRIHVRGDAEEDLAADGTRSRCKVRPRSRHFEEFAHFIAPKISRPDRGKEDYIPPHRS
jgi:hypothetical protein